VTEKRLTVILYGCDRHLWNGGPLEIRVDDVFASGGPKGLYTGRTNQPLVDLRLELPFDAGQVYGLTFSAPRHRPAWQLIRRQDFLRGADQVEADDSILRLMLVPDSPGTTDVPLGFERLQQIASPFAVPGAGVDAHTFEQLDVAAQMAFLNIEAKLRETSIDGAPLLSFVRAISHVAVDRVFLLFDAALKPRMAPSRDFAGAAGHGAPKDHPELQAHPDSWKHTRFSEGNVQLSFTRDASPLPGASPPSMVHSADVDIDLGRGLAHAREWLVNNVFQPGHKTNQSLVYGLLYSQGILPKYTLDPSPASRGRRVVPPVTLTRVAPKRRPVRRRRTRRRSTRTSRRS
jgi:hypothetical protein